MSGKDIFLVTSEAELRRRPPAVRVPAHNTGGSGASVQLPRRPNDAVCQPRVGLPPLLGGARFVNVKALGDPERRCHSRGDSANRRSLNLLILNIDLPIFPGGGAVEYLTTREMAGLVDHVGLVSMAHRREDIERARGLEEAGVRLYLWRSPFLDAPPPDPAPSLLRSAHRVVASIVERGRAWPDRPEDAVVMDGSFRNMAPAIAAALGERHWHAVAVVQSSAAAMIDYIPRPLVSVLVMHDIRSVLYERRAAAVPTGPERRRLLREARRYFQFEREQCRRYDLVLTVSKHDAEWVRAHYAPPRVEHLPLPVDTEYFRPRSGLERPGRILFTGLMSHPPNADAAAYFAREVLPAVRARLPAAEFQIVGRMPLPEVLSLGSLPGVTVTGEVPDMRPYYAEASVVVVPLRFASGSRQKILEAWCMEKCVVSTTVGAEGLDFQDGVNLAIADASDSMASTVVLGLSDPAFRDRLRLGGRDVARTRHDPGSVARTYESALREVVDARTKADEPMRVVLDMRWMVPGLAGGLEQLARSFLERLVELDHYNRYTVIVPARIRYDVPRASNLRVVSLDSAGAAGRRLMWRIGRAAQFRLRLDDWRSPDVVNLRFLRSLDAELAYSFPGYIQPDLHPLRHVLMIPDIQHEYFPEFFSEHALRERRRLFADAIGRAEHLCAISEFTRRTLIEKLGVRPDNVTTLLLAAHPMFEAAPGPADRQTHARHGLESGRYLFFPAHTWHHKNHRAAIAALALLRDRHGHTPLLVCSGGAREAQPAIEAQIREAGLERHVRFLGYCPAPELPALYRGAACVVFPSLFEGFGMPVLEGMACGVPVVCSNTTSLPEIAGDAALLVDPADPAALAAAIHAVITTPSLSADLAARGVEQASRFSWHRHTLDAIGVLHAVHCKLRRA
jgi:glycosyltransferase involved in cell wall biosynthesis